MLRVAGSVHRVILGTPRVGEHIRTTLVTEEGTESFIYRQLNATFIKLAIPLGFIGFLAYWTFVLVGPFIPIIVWSVVLTVALYPVFDWLAAVLGGRRGLAVVIGPVTWLGLGLIDGLKTLIERLDSGQLSIPPPWETVRNWPLVGPQLYDYWTLASTNVRSALSYLLPQLKPLGEILLDTVSSAGAGTLKFLVSVIIAGFLFSPGPLLVAATTTLALRLDLTHGEEFVELSGATIRALSRGVIGISLLQAVLGGIRMSLAGVPGTSLLTLAILVLGIIQIGPLIIVAPLVLARGLTTPTLVTFIGVLGGILAYGIVGLFVGPVVLAVAWDVANAWLHDSKAAAR